MAPEYGSQLVKQVCWKFSYSFTTYALYFKKHQCDIKRYIKKRFSLPKKGFIREGSFFEDWRLKFEFAVLAA